MEGWIGKTKLRMSRIDMWIVLPRLGRVWYEDMVGIGMEHTTTTTITKPLIPNKLG
jgi:hypothetical protein